MAQNPVRIREARFSDIPSIAPVMTKAYWDNYTMGQLLQYVSTSKCNFE